MHEGRHGHVDVGRLPEGAALALEAERRQRTVVGAVHRNARSEDVAMGQQVHGHERAVAETGPLLFG